MNKNIMKASTLIKSTWNAASTEVSAFPFGKESEYRTIEDNY